MGVISHCSHKIEGHNPLVTCPLSSMTSFHLQTFQPHIKISRAMLEAWQFLVSNCIPCLSQRQTLEPKTRPSCSHLLFNKVLKCTLDIIASSIARKVCPPVEKKWSWIHISCPKFSSNESESGNLKLPEQKCHETTQYRHRQGLSGKDTHRTGNNPKDWHTWLIAQKQTASIQQKKQSPEQKDSLSNRGKSLPIWHPTGYERLQYSQRTARIKYQDQSPNQSINKLNQ